MDALVVDRWQLQLVLAVRLVRYLGVPEKTWA